MDEANRDSVGMRNAKRDSSGSNACSDVRPVARVSTKISSPPSPLNATVPRGARTGNANIGDQPRCRRGFIDNCGWRESGLDNPRSARSFRCARYASESPPCGVGSGAVAPLEPKLMSWSFQYRRPWPSHTAQ